MRPLSHISDECKKKRHTECAGYVDRSFDEPHDHECQCDCHKPHYEK